MVNNLQTALEGIRDCRQTTFSVFIRNTRGDFVYSRSSREYWFYKVCYYLRAQYEDLASVKEREGTNAR